MTVTVRYTAQLRAAAGTASETVDVPSGFPASQLHRLLADRHGEPLRRLLLSADGRPQATVLLFVNDAQVCAGEDVTLREGDEVLLLSPIAGGEW